MNDITLRWADDDRAGKHTGQEQHAWGVGYMVGNRIERERIIKLLEEIAQKNAECVECGHDVSAAGLIAELKGENK